MGGSKQGTDGKKVRWGWGGRGGERELGWTEGLRYEKQNNTSIQSKLQQQ